MILTNINDFHEFWCIFDFRNDLYEIELKWEKSQAGQPKLGRPAYPCADSSCNSLVIVLLTPFFGTCQGR